MTLESPNKKSKTTEEFVEGNGYLPPIWEYDWKTESVRQMPRTPMAIAWYGILLAAGCYPIVVGLGVAVVEGFNLGFSRNPNAVFEVLVSLVFSFMAGAVYGMIMTIPAYMLLKLFSWVLGDVISGRGASGVFGGLTGFLASTGGGLVFVDVVVFSGDSFFGLTYWACFALLAIVMGYAGAIWAGYRNRNHGFPFFEPLFAVEQQFTILFLMKLTTIIAVLAMICKAAGESGLYIGMAWVAYCVVQMLLLLCDHWLRYWFGWR